MSDNNQSKKEEKSLYDRLGAKPDADQMAPMDEEDEDDGSSGRDTGAPQVEIECDKVDSKQLVELEQQLGEKHEQLLRAHAEMQNLRRRMDKEMVQARKFALEKFINDLLPTIDSLEKACQHAYSHPDAKEIHDGIDLTLKMFLGCLQSSGVEVIDPQDDVFNPEYHEAMSMIEQPGVEKNSIIDVLQKGYLLNGRLVRPARVVIAK